LRPVDQQGPLPILFRRTPYGVPDEPPKEVPTAYKKLAQDGYILVVQNVRGRFKSEGVFTMNNAPSPNAPAATNEATDAYDSIEWLVKNLPNHTEGSEFTAPPTMPFWRLFASFIRIRRLRR
jgi:uncharacterized protein